MSDADRLVAAFKALREGDGVTIEKLADHEYAWFLDLLMAPGDPKAGRAVLEQLVTGMFDEENTWASSDLGPKMKSNRRLISKAVRVALAIGHDNEGNDLVTHGNLTQRRKWACGDGDPPPDAGFFFMPSDARTHRRYEDDGLEVIARLILRHAQAHADSATSEPLENFGATSSNGPDHADSGRPPEDTLYAADPDRGSAALTRQPRSSRWRHSPQKGVAVAFSQWWYSSKGWVARHWSADKQRFVTYGAVLAVAMAASAIFSYYSLVVPTRQEASIQEVESAGAGGAGQVPPPSNVKIDNTHGWGPDRKTFTSKTPAPYPVFNSITDSNPHGDERNFVQCHDLADSGKPGAGWEDELIAHDQHSYECLIFFNNDAAANLDSIASPSPFIEGNLAAKLQNARAQVILPSPHTYNPAVVGMLTADNSNPAKVWDSCNLISPQPVTVEYQPGSARMFTNVTPKEGIAFKGGQQNMVKDGVLLGDKQDGYLGQNGGFILFTVKVSLG
ncbi:hypothetical protein [Amycolatopsis dendrobii]|uniref:Uncharacterized protein n=1 Tax=Amycolatopsis dendrobii TaxID=2760662 RepID=A0A7W3Z8K1_9PSEU|nr:hypothetical protein [Amycolatopsis dendrobii]MBB1152471.1 hypothetical protein [Amycolatopsis dendrobii]